MPFTRLFTMRFFTETDTGCSSGKRGAGIKGGSSKPREQFRSHFEKSRRTELHCEGAAEKAGRSSAGNNESCYSQAAEKQF